MAHEMYFDTYTITGVGKVTQVAEGRKDVRQREFELDYGGISRAQVGPELKGIIFKSKVDRILLVAKKNFTVEIWKKKCPQKYDGYVEKLRAFCKNNAVTFAEHSEPVREVR